LKACASARYIGVLSAV